MSFLLFPCYGALEADRGNRGGRKGALVAEIEAASWDLTAGPVLGEGEALYLNPDIGYIDLSDGL